MFNVLNKYLAILIIINLQPKIGNEYLFSLKMTDQ